MEKTNEFLSQECWSDASRTVIKKKSVGQRILDLLCDHKTTIELSGRVITLLAVLLYKAKKIRGT